MEVAIGRKNAEKGKAFFLGTQLWVHPNFFIHTHILAAILDLPFGHAVIEFIAKGFA